MEDKPESNKDYTVKQMLLDALEYIEHEETAHPTGLKGAFILFDYTEERWELPFESDDPKDNAHTYMCAGLSNDQMLLAMERIRFQLYKAQMRAETKAIMDELS